MDWLTFVSEALWPATTLAIAVLFRTPLAAAFRELTTLKLPGGVEATFEPDIRRIEEKTEAAELESEVSCTETLRSATGEIEGGERDASALGRRSLEAYLRIAPDVADVGATGLVIHAWNLVERAIYELYNNALSVGRIDRDPARGSGNRMGARTAVDKLFRADVLEVRIVDLVDDLRMTRNKVVHSSEQNITRGQALSYLEAADAVVGMLYSKGERLSGGLGGVDAPGDIE